MGYNRNNIENWIEVREKYGVQIENDLRVMASSVSKAVKKTGLKDKSDRPNAYFKWRKKPKVLLK